jgi:tetratricopeptide (TPR) repeat protein
LIKLARAHYRLGANDRALALLQEAANSLEPPADLRLILLSRENAALYLCAEGEAERAMEVLKETRILASELDDPIEALRRHWKEGLISSALDEPDAAEDRLLDVKAGFGGRGLRHDEAMVALDLATIYAKEGRRLAAAELLEFAVPVFQELSLPSKIREARLLLGQAASGY